MGHRTNVFARVHTDVGPNGKSINIGGRSQQNQLVAAITADDQRATRTLVVCALVAGPGLTASDRRTMGDGRTSAFDIELPHASDPETTVHVRSTHAPGNFPACDVSEFGPLLSQVKVLEERVLQVEKLYAPVGRVFVNGHSLQHLLACGAVMSALRRTEIK